MQSIIYILNKVLLCLYGYAVTLKLAALHHFKISGFSSWELKGTVKKEGPWWAITSTTSHHIFQKVIKIHLNAN